MPNTLYYGDNLLLKHLSGAASDTQVCACGDTSQSSQEAQRTFYELVTTGSAPIANVIGAIRPLARNKYKEAPPEVNRSSKDTIKSKQRVADHGEVFTDEWMVNAMLDLVKDESERIDSRFLEPACGDGNFLVKVLQRKLKAVDRKYGKTPQKKRHFALLALMCIYGIELLHDNIVQCRANLLKIFAEHLKLDEADELYRVASYVLSQNIVHGDAMAMLACDNENTTKCDEKRPIIFAEWGSVGKGRFQRRDFSLRNLAQSSSLDAEGLFYAERNKHESLTPEKTVYKRMTVPELLAFAQGATR